MNEVQVIRTRPSSAVMVKAIFKHGEIEWYKAETDVAAFDLVKNLLETRPGIEVVTTRQF